MSSIRAYGLFYDCLCYLLPFRLGGAVKEREEEEDSIIDLVNNGGVCYPIFI